MNKPSFAAPARKGRPSSRALDADPATIAEFVANALENPATPPPPPAPLAPEPPNDRKRYSGVWHDMTPEERSAYAKKLAAMRRPENMRRAYKRTRGPKGWTAEDAAAAKVAARLAAERLVERLIANGTIPRSDIDGANATVAALTLLAAPGGAKADKLAAARKLLRHYHADLAGMV